MEPILTFLANSKLLIVAIAGVLESLVVLINVWKRFSAATRGEVESMSASPSKFKAFLWVINPVNVFRKPR